MSKQTTARRRGTDRTIIRGKTMTNLNEYMTVEQQEIIDQLNKLTKDEHRAGYNKYDLERTMKDLRSASSDEDLQKKVDRITEQGVADTLSRRRDAEYQIERKTRDIEELEKQIEKLKAEKAKAEQEKELLEQLEATGIQSILDEMVDVRRQEMENIEYEYYYKVYKAEELLHPGSYSFASKVVIRCDRWVVEKGNRENAKRLYEVFQIDWKDRTKLVDELKTRYVNKVVVDKNILTKKIQKEFKDFVVGDDSRWRLF